VTKDFSKLVYEARMYLGTETETFRLVGLLLRASDKEYAMVLPGSLVSLFRG